MTLSEILLSLKVSMVVLVLLRSSRLGFQICRLCRSSAIQIIEIRRQSTQGKAELDSTDRRSLVADCLDRLWWRRQTYSGVQ